jgi:hypothetical protein
MSAKRPGLPDPTDVARREAEQIEKRREEMIEGRLERSLADFVSWDREALLVGLEAFHRERMESIPPPAEYPEAGPWVEHVLGVDEELQRLGGLSDREMAILRSLTEYLTFRGWGVLRPPRKEGCRVVYLPDSDRGEFHVKNVDDPLTYWEPEKGPPDPPEFPDLMLDGVGAGLHIDDEPEQIFPLPVRDMLRHHAHDVPAAVEFLERYCPFWGGQNILLHDRQRRSVAIEKSSYNFMDVYDPDPSGGSHISGMVCRDPKTEQGRYVVRKREEFLEMFGRGPDCSSAAFWRACDECERMLARLTSRPHVTVDEILGLLTTPWPDGLNKDGALFHPDQPYVSYTLRTLARLPDEGRVLRWQRDGAGLYPEEPEVFEYGEAPL